MEKIQCQKDFENQKLVMSEDKCDSCEYKYECKFMQMAMSEVVEGC